MLLHLLIRSLCVCVCMNICVWKSEDNLQESAVSLYHREPKVFRFGGKYLYIVPLYSKLILQTQAAHFLNAQRPNYKKQIWNVSPRLASSFEPKASIPHETSGPSGRLSGPDKG